MMNQEKMLEMMMNLMSATSEAADLTTTEVEDFSSEVIQADGDHKKHHQSFYQTATVLDSLTVSGGLPTGCTISLCGPSGVGKTRLALSAASFLSEVCSTAYICSEEPWVGVYGRQSLASRFDEVSDGNNPEHLVVMDMTTFSGDSLWADFIARYRYLVETEKVEFIIVDSLTSLDPARRRSAEHMSQLRSYNLQHGVSCIVINQVKDTGEVNGGSALIHASDMHISIDVRKATTKALAEEWGVPAKSEITTISASKSVVCPIHSGWKRVEMNDIGVLCLMGGE